HLHGAVGGDPDASQGVADGAADDVGESGKVARELLVRFEAARYLHEMENLAVNAEADMAIEQKHLDPAFGNAVLTAESFDGGLAAGHADPRQPGVPLLDPDKSVVARLDIIRTLEVRRRETLDFDAVGRRMQPAYFPGRGVQPAPVARRGFEDAQVG